MRLIDHWDLHWRLWESFEKVVKHCWAVGATVMLEWPRFCDYWQEKRVAELLAEMKFNFTDFDGCMRGLVAKHKGNASPPIRKPWRIAYLNSSIASDLNKMCDGSHRHVLRSVSNALYSQGCTPLICKAVWKTLGDCRGKRSDSEGCMIHVCIAAGLSQKDSCLSSVLPSAPSSLCCIAMADRSSPEETSRRLAAERERPQAFARRNEEKAKERMRLKLEAAAAAEQAKAAAERAAKAAAVAFPMSEDIRIKAPTRPPPGVSPGRRGGTSPAAASRRPTPPPKRAMSPRHPSHPPPARSPSEEHVSVSGDLPDVAAAKAKGSGDTQPAKAGESSQRRGPPKVSFVAESYIIPIPGETDQEWKCRVVRHRRFEQRNYFLVCHEYHVISSLGTRPQRYGHLPDDRHEDIPAAARVDAS